MLVPEEFSTIQKAIDKSREGDVISIAPGVYFERIIIYEKVLTISGRDTYTPTEIKAEEILGPSAENNTPMIHIRNSTVRMENIRVSSFIVSKTVLVEKGDVEIVECEFTGSETQSAFGQTLNPSQPALFLLGCVQNQIRISDSFIRGGDNSEKETLGGTAIRIDSCIDTLLYFEYSTILGGHGTSTSEAVQSTSTNPGGPALHITDSKTLSFQIKNTTLQGGQGAGSVEMRGHGSTGAGFTFPGKNGGKAGIVETSTVTINGGQFLGGDGGSGLRYYSEFAEKWVIGEPGLGGCGIQVTNGSIVEHENGSVTGGFAGATNETQSEEICIDETSTYTRIMPTFIQGWELH